MIGSYGKVWAQGRPTANIYFGPVVVQEKIDGSQISFARLDGKLYVKSKNQYVVEGVADLSEPVVAANGMFQIAVDEIANRFALLPEGYVFRGEYLNRPKHNILRYDRVPEGNIVVFDIYNCHSDMWLVPSEAERLSEQINLEYVQTFYQGHVETTEQLMSLHERESMLGGQLIEGFVVKNYAQFDTMDGNPLKLKVVRSAFKEQHGAEWKKDNPNTRDFVFNTIEQYRTQARWAKAVQHLRERGELQDDPRDIGPLMKELAEDFIAECKDEIMDALWKQYGKRIVRGVQGGFAEWYKSVLAEQMEAAA